MKKRILAGLIGSMLVASVGFAAPVISMETNQTAVGYNYSKPKINLEGVGSVKENSDSFYIQHKLNDKVVLGFEQTKISVSDLDFKTSDLLAQYSVDENVNLVLGARRYSIDGNSETKTTYGINGKTSLGDNLIGYASFLTNSYEDEWRVGANYQMTKNTFLDLNYTSHDYDGLTIKGVGFGIGFTF